MSYAFLLYVTIAHVVTALTCLFCSCWIYV